MKHLPVLTPVAAAILLAAATLAQAQVQPPQLPDAGRLLQENAAPLLREPSAAPAATITLPPSAQKTASGGTTVRLSAIRISGNTLFTEKQLLAVLGDFRTQSFDLAGLETLAQSLSIFYQAAGYPFARAYLPAQSITEGMLQIGIVEGRYGEVTAEGDPQFTRRAQDFLSPLKSGEVIQNRSLERATLLLNDQPGSKTVPMIRPGSETGTGDLIADVQRYQPYSGDLGIDNYGNRYTGRYRGRLNLNANSPFMLGDQVTLQSLYTNEGMWFGSLGYHLPLNANGLRGRIGYTHSYYALGSDFSSLQASGTADILSGGLSYALLRSQQANLSLSAGIDHKRLRDVQGTAGTGSEKRSDVLPLSLSFDIRDRLGRAGLTYGTLTWSLGRLSLDNALAVTDQASARSAGNFGKVNLDVARIQSLTERIDLYGRFAAQYAAQNLDSSEKFGLGGANGVRAYPSGEGYGDEGWLAQSELRYAMGASVPFAFFDAGSVKVNHRPWAAVDNRRSIAGGGLGLRYARGPWSASMSLAWRTQGEAARSDKRADSPTLWASLQYRF